MTTFIPNHEIAFPAPDAPELPANPEQLPIGQLDGTRFLVGPSLDSGWDHDAAPFNTDGREEFYDAELQLRRRALAVTLGAFARYGCDTVHLETLGLAGIREVYRLHQENQLTGASLDKLIEGMSRPPQPE